MLYKASSEVGLTFKLLYVYISHKLRVGKVKQTWDIKSTKVDHSLLVKGDLSIYFKQTLASVSYEEYR